MDDDAHLVGEGEQDVDLVGGEAGFLLGPDGDDPDDVVLDLQGGIKGGAAFVEGGDLAVRLRRAGVRLGVLEGDVMPGLGDTGLEAVVFFLVQMLREGPAGLFLAVILDHPGVEVLATF
ncbi:MAG: hypothetical protein MUF17_11045, partial [Syntrophales bacterium]|nr:hypothetical protein [Syntrophales bacterium]